MSCNNTDQFKRYCSDVSHSVSCKRNGNRTDKKKNLLGFIKLTQCHQLSETRNRITKLAWCNIAYGKSLNSRQKFGSSKRQAQLQNSKQNNYCKEGEKTYSANSNRNLQFLLLSVVKKSVNMGRQSPLISHGRSCAEIESIISVGAHK